MITTVSLTEASANVFCVFGDTIVSPPKDNHILGGITLDGVFDLRKAWPLKPKCARCRRPRWAADELGCHPPAKACSPSPSRWTTRDRQRQYRNKPGPLLKENVRADAGGHAGRRSDGYLHLPTPPTATPAKPTSSFRPSIR